MTTVSEPRPAVEAVHALLEQSLRVRPWLSTLSSAARIPVPDPRRPAGDAHRRPRPGRPAAVRGQAGQPGAALHTGVPARQVRQSSLSRVLSLGAPPRLTHDAHTCCSGSERAVGLVLVLRQDWVSGEAHTALAQALLHPPVR